MHSGTPFSLIDKAGGYFELPLFLEFKSISGLMFHLEHNSYVE
jgi:hypothetical protein